MDIHDIISRCDHTILRPDVSAAEIKQLCDEAINCGAASVCIPPCHVRGAKRYVSHKLPICTVIGFPNGYMTTAAKCFEIKDAIKNGADELDAVINLSMARDCCWDELFSELKELRKASHGKILKIIIETCLLSDESKIKLCRFVADSGADYIKTSTGFSHGGATAADIALLREHSPFTLKIKAAGGIHTLADAADFISLGADRLGSSRIIKLAHESGLI